MTHRRVLDTVKVGKCECQKSGLTNIINLAGKKSNYTIYSLYIYYFYYNLYFSLKLLVLIN